MIGGLLALLGGCAVSYLNYRINLAVLRRKPDALARMSIVREILSVAYFVAAYLLARTLPWGPAPLLVGAAAGLTVPSVLLSMRLARINDAMNAEKDELTEKGADEHE